MKVILFKLENPGNEYEWWVKKVTIKSSKDIEQLQGVCGRSYAEICHVDKDDDPFLIKEVNEYLRVAYSNTAKDIIMWLFKLINKTRRNEKCEKKRK